MIARSICLLPASDKNPCHRPSMFRTVCLVRIVFFYSSSLLGRWLGERIDGVVDQRHLLDDSERSVTVAGSAYPEDINECQLRGEWTFGPAWPQDGPNSGVARSDPR